MLGNAQHKTQWNESIGTFVSSGTRDKRNVEMGALKRDEPSLYEQHRDRSKYNIRRKGGRMVNSEKVRKAKVEPTRQPWLLWPRACAANI